MALVRLDSSEFPPLGRAIAANASKIENWDTFDDTSEDILFKSYVKSTRQQRNGSSKEEHILTDGDEFLRRRVGYQIIDYEEDLHSILNCNEIKPYTDFILAPITPKRQAFYHNHLQLLPDVVLPHDLWHSKVAVSLDFQLLSSHSYQAEKDFDKLFRHALYLSSPVIVVSCPDSELAFVTVASIINERLTESQNRCTVLFKLPLVSKNSRYQLSCFADNTSNDKISPLNCDSSSAGSSNQCLSDRTQPVEDKTSESGYDYSSQSDESKINIDDGWRQWHSLRMHLKPDTRIGVCLTIDDELPDDHEELAKWSGEPVHMIVVHSDQFAKSQKSTPYLSQQCRKFICDLTRANSFKLSLVLQGHLNKSIKDYLLYLEFWLKQRITEDYDDLTRWNDKILTPLQPLSSNLNSETYGIFELDSTKYNTYKKAMVKSIKQLIEKHGNKREEKLFNLMVLGAGRGPLVDSMIEALEELMSVNEIEMKRYKFILYALDKNPSSVVSLYYKQKNKWKHPEDYYTTVVVESDMRTWYPEDVKADIIATELLGSFSDNELSPECIDGVWRLATKETQSIPKEYSSYIAPICSYKLYQELYRKKTYWPHPFDQIHVVRLKNFYSISHPQELFKFVHEDLSLPPKNRSNERYTKLTFWSKVNTVCHGFAGYFEAQLFEDITLSTVKDRETYSMNSWFPAFIPLEVPVELRKGSQLVIHFWRKENSTSVWYQWVITEPQRSRIYSLVRSKTEMSKYSS